MLKYYLVIFSCFLLNYPLIAQGFASKTEAKIDLVQAQYGLSGKDVLTIMMDRGIDYRHPDFIDAHGKTRIAYIYDLYDDSGANDADNPFGVGTIYDSTEINAALENGGEPLVNDIYGHGTATTGIMCGNGSAVDPHERFRGVAYRSTIISIIVTKDYVPPFGNEPGQQGAYNPGLLPIAFQFAEQKIAELDMPSVTLLNIGSLQNPTDGSTSVCELIDAYVENGNTFVCGVGDDGGKDNHMIETLTENQNTEFAIQKGEAGNLRFIAWYPENDRFEFTIQRPNGEVEGPFLPPSSATDARDNFLNHINIYHRGADVEFSNSSADWRQLMIDFFGETGTYTININPSDINAGGQINAFLNPARFSNNNSFLNNSNPGGNINSFAACHASISPGDYVATNQWTDINGISRTKTDQGAPGELWIGSSVGPTMDGRIGVDLVAPGEIAWGAYGNGSYYSNFPFNLLENSMGYYGIQTAVSAAAPITAGVIALMLEVNPDLSPEEIKSILQQSARSDSFTGSTPNNEYGYGKLDALAAIAQTFETVGLEDLNTKEADFSIYPNPADHYVHVSMPGIIQNAQFVSVYTLDGQKIKDMNIKQNDQINLDDLKSGVYLLGMIYQESPISKLLYKK
jgi:minor extracellular serine protease Vpr